MGDPSWKDDTHLWFLSSRLVSDDPTEEASLDEADDDEDADESFDFFLCSFLEVFGTIGGTFLLSSFSAFIMEIHLGSEFTLLCGRSEAFFRCQWEFGSVSIFSTRGN